jgi:acetate kinase
MNILVLNAGSSSFKASLYRLSKKDLPLDPVVPLWTGEIDWNSTGLEFRLRKRERQPRRSVSYRRGRE